MATQKEVLLNLQKSVWQSLEDLCAALNVDDWNTITDCPTWTVKDCISHLVGIEHRLLGRDVPNVDLQDTNHLRNDQGFKNEVDVVLRRSNTVEELIQEFRNVNAERLIVLESQSDFRSAAESPIGQGSVADQVSVRVFDCWIHEQDIRRAVGKQGNLSGSVAEHSFQRMTNVMPYVFGKKVNAPEGSSVRFKIHGAHSFDIGVKVVEKRAVLVPELSQPTIEMEMGSDAFICLACGRWDPDMAIADGRVVIKGDESFGALIAQEMIYMI
jgi:uncharacterized protein (TIGR03083 family)